MSTSTSNQSEHLRRAAERSLEVRRARAELRRQIGAGELSAGQAILHPPEQAQGTTIYDLLTAQRRWGRARAIRFLSRLEIRETKPVGALTDHQRKLLARALGQGVER